MQLGFFVISLSLASGCGSHLIVEAQGQRGELRFSKSQRFKSQKLESRGEWALGPFKQSEKIFDRSLSHWTVLGGPFKGPEISTVDYFNDENSEILVLENMVVTTTFSWADVLLGWFPGFSKRTVRIRGQLP